MYVENNNLIVLKKYFFIIITSFIVHVIVCFIQKKLASFKCVPDVKMCRLNHLTFNHLTTAPPSEPHMSGLPMSAKSISLRNMLCNGFYIRSGCDFRNILRYVFQGRLPF